MKKMNLHIYQLKNDGLVMSFMKTKLQTARMFNMYFFFFNLVCLYRSTCEVLSLFSFFFKRPQFKNMTSSLFLKFLHSLKKIKLLGQFFLQKH